MGMDCRKIEPLLSPYLDGELMQHEAAEVKAHLARCARCNQDYHLMVQISGALQQAAAMEVPVPTGFTASLMERINNEEKVISMPSRQQWWQQRWRQTVAGVAAAIMVAIGSLSLTSGPIWQVAENPPATVQTNNNGAVVNDPGNNMTVQSPDVNNGSVDPSVEPQNGSAVIAQNPPSTFEPLVLLNKERTLTTTFLQIKASDSSVALQQALDLAARYSAPVQNLGQQVNENGSSTVLQIMVAKASASDLFSDLTKLGSVTSKESNKNDITTQFADKLSQYQALVSQRAALKDSSQLESLDQKIKTLGNELKDWDLKAEQETIILVLEK
jgi:negative regulator of sigma E activity